VQYGLLTLLAGYFDYLDMEQSLDLPYSKLQAFLATPLVAFNYISWDNKTVPAENQGKKLALATASYRAHSFAVSN